MRRLASLLSAILLPGMLWAQVSAPSTPAANPQPNVPTTQVAPATMAASLPQLQEVIESTRVDLAKLRIDKWKTDAAVKQQAQGNVDSLQRNMTNALPGMAAAVQANPASLAAAFKLYRNLNALYDVLAGVTESAGAFGAKDEYSALASDTAKIDSLRRSMADQLESLANIKDAELTRMQNQLRQAATVTAPPKKVVVDDSEEQPPKKPVRKKKAAAPKSEAPPPKSE